MKHLNLSIFSTRHVIEYVLVVDDDAELPQTCCFGDMFLLDRVISRAVPRFSFTENPETKVVSLTLPCFITIQFGNGCPNDIANVSPLESFLKDIAQDMQDTGVIPMYVLYVMMDDKLDIKTNVDLLPNIKPTE